MRLLLIILSILGAVAFVAPAYAQSCTPYSSCKPGNTGNGGCYNPSTHHCGDGLVYPAGHFLCRKGSEGPGGSYPPGTHNCAAGAIYRAPYQWCMSGPKGRGGEYNPATHLCTEGKISKIGP
jgi:hypothetical protein